ncbi:MAG TPA: aminomethyl-transferring glycine dehydrogenase, partial [Vicinamibacterales bacterium]|nr:aminomethyl-transferring glycine dehydrogenase [Vicinamibacterales bacterium]
RRLMAELLQAPVTASSNSEPGFAARHIGPNAAEQAEMLATVGASSLDALLDEAIPPAIRRRDPLPLPPAEREHDYLARLWTVASKNQVFRSFIGLGYHDTITPAAILRNVFENPGWYTPYTPYQAEIAQGRLESLLNFQTMVKDLTAMDVANASLLDEATAAAEGMALAHRVCPRKDARVFLADRNAFPQTLELLAARAEPLGLQLRIVDVATAEIGPDVFGVLLQSPDANGLVRDLSDIIERVHEAKALAVVASDLLACALITPPGEMGADVVVGSAQRFGVPLGYGGPHAAFFATRQAFVRHLPGRLIGVSVDAHGQPAYRMALATREQHIRREKATSNICTAQALLASMAAMYAVYHGPEGLRAIATRLHEHARALERLLWTLGCRQLNEAYFDTIRVEVPRGTEALRERALAAGINLGYIGRDSVRIALDETVTAADLGAIARVFDGPEAKPISEAEGHAAGPLPVRIPAALDRTSEFLTHGVFNTHRSETQMMRFLRRLERKDLGLDTSMIPLGSCTMKLNAATEMLPLTWEPFSRLHPFAPAEQAEGYQQVIAELSDTLCAVTGFAGVSLQPNSGAQGEFAGLLAIRAYHRSRGDERRTVVLIPASAHGTNPASAALAGLRVVVVANAPDGSVDLADLTRKADAHADTLACLMVTYPSTHGVYESGIREICDIVHRHGGQVYMDGANMNAQVGLTSPARIGADVCHLNLHKTFAIPHGGGGPGMGPIAVAPHLVQFLPGHPAVAGGGAARPPVSAAPWGSASILLVSHAYVCMLGADGMTAATHVALLNANYLKARLEPHYPVLYAGAKGRVAHELIFDLRGFKSGGVDEMDVAKRLIDYGFHAPTVSFPVAGTLMVEPTESEDLAELDRFCDAMIQIRKEIDDVVSGRADRADNVLTQAPHTAAAVSATTWTHPYSREEAAYPLPFVRAHKFWPAVGRVDNPFGDRNLVCTCPPIEVYA